MLRHHITQKLKHIGLNSTMLYINHSHFLHLFDHLWAMWVCPCHAPLSIFYRLLFVHVPWTFLLLTLRTLVYAHSLHHFYSYSRHPFTSRPCHETFALNSKDTHPWSDLCLCMRHFIISHTTIGSDTTC
jgi:hypothetical protein